MIFNKFRLIFLLALFCWNYAVNASSALDQIMTSTKGAQVFSPSYVWGTRTFINEMPELTDININNPHILMLTRYLEENGIGYIGGDGKHIHSFDLYMDFAVHLSNLFPSYGPMPENNTAKSYWASHDGIHQISGVLGPRLVDLKDRRKSIRRMSDIILKNEGVASAWSTYYYLQWLYSYRDKLKDRTPEQRAEFERFNRGTLSHGPATPKDIMEINQAIRFFHPLKTFKLVQGRYDEEFYRRAVSAGVPMVVPNFEDRAGKIAQNLLMRWGIPSAVAFIFGIFHPYTGYFAQNNFSMAYAEFVYSPWFVAWADDFEIGVPLDQMEQDLNHMIKNFNDGKLLIDNVSPPPHTFELMYVRNYLSRFARKLYELEYLAKQSAILSASELKELSAIKQKSIALAKEILDFKNSRQTIDEKVLENFSAQTLALIEGADRKLNVYRIDWKSIAAAEALPEGKNFWRDPFQFLVKRPKEMTTVFGAGDLMQHPQPEFKGYESIPCETLL